MNFIEIPPMFLNPQPALQPVLGITMKQPVKVKWEEVHRGNQWNLLVKNGCKWRIVATVWANLDNEATWHTWDLDGVGGENDVETASSSNLACRRARAEAANSAIEQGFI